MNTEQKGFVIPSTEELENRASSAKTVLPSDDYIVRIESINFVKAPTYLNGAFNGPKDWKYTVICSVCATKSGDPLVDVDNEPVNILGTYLFKDINPYATGKQKSNGGGPTIFRSFVSHAQGVDVDGPLKLPDAYILELPDKNIVEDTEVRDQVLSEIASSGYAKGYTAVGKIESLVHKYIGCSIEIKKDRNGNDKNIITRFSKLPNSFQRPDEAVEAKADENFDKFYTAIQERKQKTEQQASSQQVSYANSSEDMDDEVVIDDIAL